MLGTLAAVALLAPAAGSARVEVDTPFLRTQELPLLEESELAVDDPWGEAVATFGPGGSPSIWDVTDDSVLRFGETLDLDGVTAVEFVFDDPWVARQTAPDTLEVGEGTARIPPLGRRLIELPAHTDEGQEGYLPIMEVLSKDVAARSGPRIAVAGSDRIAVLSLSSFVLTDEDLTETILIDERTAGSDPSSWEKPGPLASGDFNEDGRTDLVTAIGPAAGPTVLTLLRGKGDDTFDQESVATLPATFDGLEAADLDADGHLDVVASGSASGIGIHRFYGDGRGGFETGEPLARELGPTTRVAVLDPDDRFSGSALAWASGARLFYAHRRVDDRRSYKPALVTTAPGAFKDLVVVGDNSFALENVVAIERVDGGGSGLAVYLNLDAGQRNCRTAVGQLILGTRHGDRIGPESFGQRILGLGGGDTILGGGGRDCINAGKGRDLVLGGVANDTVFGGPGADRIFAGNGDNRIEGEGGRDLLFGGPSSEVLHGGSGPDWIDDGRGKDVLIGSDGSDRLRAAVGSDRLLGGRGDDRAISAGGGADHVACGPGNDLAIVDRQDAVATDCEVVRRSASANFNAKCARRLTCTAKLRLVTKRKYRVGKRKRRVLLGGSRIEAAQGSRQSVAFIVNTRQGKRLMRRQGVVRARVNLRGRRSGKLTTDRSVVSVRRP